MNYQAQIKRVVKCTPERAFALWTDPALITQWFCPRELPSEISIDARPGGVFRFVVHYKPDDFFACTCHFRAVEPHRRISFSWQWDESSFDPGVSEVEVFFDPVPGGTAITLTHTKLASDVSIERHSHGWNEVLNRFDAFVNEFLEEKV